MKLKTKLPEELPRRLSTWEFTKRYVPLDFDIETLPQMRRPLEVMDNELNSTIILNGPIQTFKTLAVTLATYRNFDHRPGRGAFFNLTGDAVKEYAEDKFLPTFDAISPLRDILLNSKRKVTHLQFAHGHPWRALTAGTRANRNSKTLEQIDVDEAWEYDAGWLKEIEGRASASNILWRHQLRIPSSGFTKNSEPDKRWQESTREEWQVPCPECGAYFNFNFDHGTDEQNKLRPGGLRFDHDSDAVKFLDGTLNREAFEASIYYECPHCAHRITYTPKTVETLNRAGRWHPHNDHPARRTWGFHWDAVQFMPWPILADEWRIANEAKRRGDYTLLEEFVRKRKAASWSVREHVAFKKVTNAGAYRIHSDQPADKQALNDLAAAQTYKVMTIDVQQDHFFYVIRGWTRGQESPLLAYGRVLTGGHLRDIQLQWGIPDHGGRFLENPCAVFLDGNYNTDEVRKLAQAYNWYVLRGRDEIKAFKHPDNIRRIYSPIYYVDAYQGTGQQGQGVVGEWYYSQKEARNRLALLRDLRDPAAWTYAKDASAEYVNQLNAWHKQVGERKRDGAEVIDWVKTHRHDHYHDCEKMQIIPATMAQVIGAESLTEEDSDPDQDA